MSSDSRWGDDARDNSWEYVQRDREPREPDRDSNDPRDAFMRHLDLPRGPDREIVHERNREHSLRGSETRTLATVGAFRVVPTGQLRDHNNAAAHDRSADIRHLREQGLIETVRVPGHRGSVAVLTKQGRDLLERHRDTNSESAQRFYADLKRTRELEHDSQIYSAYLQAAERMQERGVRVNRVVLDYELKSDYQKWLHEHDGDRDDYDGHHDRTDEEIRAWAAEHNLPYFDDQVHFPDFRIEYEEPDGRLYREDAEVLTVHYRGAHAGGRGTDPDLASELIR